MNYTELSDLEEGEILEYESVSSSYPGSNLGVRNWPLESSVKEDKNGGYGFSENKVLYLSEQGKDGYINSRLKEKLNLNDRQGENKSSISMTDLESISSEGEYKSDEEDKCSAGESEYYKCRNGEARKGKKHSSHFYGAVEDIMSEIGETICRKSRNYKKRKSKESKLDLDKASNSNYDLWRREIFYSHLKSRKHKRRGSFCDADTDLGKYRTEKKKKRKRRSVYYEEEETAAKKSRDFDEMRRNLLEKLKKQKAEGESKAPPSETPVEVESSEIQEIDMLIDCTNYVDNPPDALSNSAGEERGNEEKDGEDELDLVKLRLIALASNKKRKAEENTSKLEKAEDSGEKPDCSRPRMDLDRNELQLRAEALKTALLKKHQRRLNRLKVGKPTETSSSSINQVANSVSSPAEDDVKRAHVEAENAKLDADASKENVERETGDCSIVDVVPLPHLNVEESKPNDVTFSNGNSKKAISRGKSKRRKRKSVSFANNLKENNEKSEALDEDDDTLRTQLLTDLMKRKSLKDQERKSVLMDSIQTAANKPSPSLTNTEPPKSAKPLPEIKNNSLKKINIPKTSKPTVVAKIPKPEIQRIIVHLGSEDSSDEEGGCPQPPQEETESKGNAVAEPPSASQGTGEGTQAKYERSVELLLSQARKKIEGEKRIAMSALSTPEAVYKHLPPSQRLEYIRLKQKIAERESLRKQKKENPANSVLASSGVQPVQISTASEESPKSVPSKPSKFGIVAKTDSNPQNSLSDRNSSHKSMSDASKSGVVRPSPTAPKKVGAFTGPNGGKTNAGRRLVVNRLINRLSEFPGRGSNAAAAPPGNGPRTAAAMQRNVLLLPSSQALLSKLKLLLKKIKIEKTIEENYETEVSKLKNQLSLFEKKKCEQRFKIKKLWEESMKTYNAIQGITAKTKGKVVPKESGGGEETKRESKEVSTDKGKKVESEAAKEAAQKADGDEGKKVSDETETEITQTESDKEPSSDDKISETLAEDTSSGPCPVKYDSPLQVFSQVSDSSTRVDPNVVVCQFDLMGVCKDEECTYQHLRILAK